MWDIWSAKDAEAIACFLARVRMRMKMRVGITGMQLGVRVSSRYQRGPMAAVIDIQMVNGRLAGNWTNDEPVGSNRKAAERKQVSVSKREQARASS